MRGAKKTMKKKYAQKYVQKYAQKYAQIQKQIRFLPLLLIPLLVLSGVFGTWYVKADGAIDPEWRLEAELLSDAGDAIGNGGC